ncbi:hypothetical protein IX317_000639 [Fusobacterium sp. DD29]|uniref:hypothetical protein n=1 Tax=unclassified Fusobacterium TaxID=2648384 RepID=UPI001B8B360E|nr:MULTISPECIES: hypothetical protein [unclassified Fusobacterium]MBR8700239.1 hypothetical protein [Fusobacterium sp. DD45]MBR8710506.1 hypothetical protein [Fusobacterium sp. DD28]MBR8748978.1 hypothetical protein [Fusobacterium sp. DD29]MBR8751044.1 hypothetical protein [Fusobacterium sp. DD26]MBR8761284.1 hypothetical protein [Fusobacterium sp. DD25]
MISDVEKSLFQFLKGILTDKGVNVYRGVLPDNNHLDRENGKKTNEYFPFVLIRISHFEQSRSGIDVYDAFADIELWIGTKEQDYLEHLELGDYLRGKFLETSTIDGKYAVKQEIPFSVDFYADDKEPFYFSTARFRVSCPATQSEIINKELNRLIGR